jgi:hypothetical protein
MTNFDLKFLDTLEKGSCIPADEVSKIAGVEDFTPESLNFVALQLAGILEQALWAQGKRWSLRAVKGAVYVLTDAESVEFQAKRFRTGVKKIRRSKRHVDQVDISQLGEVDRRQHELESRKISASLVAVQKSLREIKHHSNPTESDYLAPPPKLKPVGCFKPPKN